MNAFPHNLAIEDEINVKEQDAANVVNITGVPKNPDVYNEEEKNRNGME